MENEENIVTGTSLFQRRIRQYIGAAAACMGGFSLGCGLGWSAPSVEILKTDYNISIFLTNVIASALVVGAAFGTVTVPFLIDNIGRKWTMLGMVPIFLTGWVLLICAGSMVPLFVIGRVLTGACGGMICVAAPMYSAEISEKEIRGMTGTFFQLLLVIGILYSYLTGFTGSMVLISSLCCIGPIIFGVVMIFMPESPLYYLRKNREEDARRSMRFFRGTDYDIEPEIEAFKEQVERSKQQKISVSIFMRKSVLKTMGVAYGLMFAQQFSGINAMIFYGVTILESTGVGGSALVQLIIFGVVQVVACVASALLIDKLGRKILMIISEALMSLCLAALAVFFLVKERTEETHPIAWLPLTSVCLYIIAFCLGAGPIPWMYMGEIFPTSLKGIASSSAAFFNWCLAFVITLSFSSAVETFGEAPVLFFFALVCAAAVFFVIICMVETKGKTFAQIQEEYGTSTLEQNGEQVGDLPME